MQCDCGHTCWQAIECIFGILDQEAAFVSTKYDKLKWEFPQFSAWFAAFFRCNFEVGHRKCDFII